MLRFVKYSAIGWLGVGVQLSVLTFLRSAGSFHYLLATALAVETTIVHNFFWHERFTFRDRALARASSSRLLRLLHFNSTTGLVALSGNLVFMRLFVGELGVHYLVGSLASIACCALVNFLVSDRFVFIARGERPCTG